MFIQLHITDVIFLMILAHMFTYFITQVCTCILYILFSEIFKTLKYHFDTVQNMVSVGAR